MEEWKPIGSLNNRYEASNYGNIRNSSTHKILKQFINKFGYKILTVRPIPKQQINIRVHRVVAEAFLGKCPDGYVVNHKDGDKSNNNIDNLEYVTPSENNQHALNNNLRSHPHNFSNMKRGENHYNASITEEQAKYILRLHKETHFGARKLSKMTNISIGAIGNLIAGRSWKHLDRN